MKKLDAPSRNKLIRVLMTWLVTVVMVFVFTADIAVNLYGNHLVNAIPVPDESADHETSDDRIHFLNTANSDCIVLESNGHYALVDTGEGNENPRRKTAYRGYRDDVLGYLKTLDRREDGKVHFDFMLVTHYHYDHDGNCEAVVNDDELVIEKAYMKPYNTAIATDVETNAWGNLDVYNAIFAALQKKDVPVISDLPDGDFAFGDFTLRFFNTVTPPEIYNRGENSDSVGVRVTKGEQIAFLAADYTAESGLEETYGDEIGEVTLLKVGHHGYFGSSSRSFLKKLKPQIAIVTNYRGKIYPNVTWNLTVVAHAATFSTANRDGIIAAFTDDGRILLTQRIMP